MGICLILDSWSCSLSPTENCYCADSIMQPIWLCRTVHILTYLARTICFHFHVRDFSYHHLRTVSIEPITVMLSLFEPGTSFLYLVIGFNEHFQNSLTYRTLTKNRTHATPDFEQTTVYKWYARITYLARAFSVHLDRFLSVIGTVEPFLHSRFFLLLSEICQVTAIRKLKKTNFLWAFFSAYHGIVNARI